MPAATDVYGLLLAGGESRRMGRDKALLEFDGEPQLLRAHALLSEFCARVFVSVRPEQSAEPTRAGLEQIVDEAEGIGPAAGISAAQARHPERAWLVLACDLPRVDAATVEHLLAHRDADRDATAYRSSYDGLPEPMCAVWEMSIAGQVRDAIEAERYCMRKMLLNADTLLLEPHTPGALDNINSPQDLDELARGQASE